MRSSYVDLTVATSFGMILKICLIMTQACTASAEGLAWSTAKFHWHGGWRSMRKSCAHGYMTCKRGGRMLQLVVVPRTPSMRF